MNGDSCKPTLALAAPEDRRNLTAFDDWVTGMAVAFPRERVSDMPPDRLEASWLQFWGDQLTLRSGEVPEGGSTASLLPSVPSGVGPYR